MKKKHSKRRTFLILAAAVIALSAVLFFVIRKDPVTTAKLTKGVEPFLRDEEPAPGGELPDNPRFVLYDMDEKVVYIPDPRYYPDGTDDPDLANVIVAYRQEFVGGRFYVSTENGPKDVYSRDLVVYIIRKDDWSLIAVRVFEENGGVREKERIRYMNRLRSEATEFINSVMSEGAEEPQIEYAAAPQADAP